MQLNSVKEVQERNANAVGAENSELYLKLSNLENVFVGISEESGSALSNEYAINSLLNENANIKKRIQDLEDEQAQLRVQKINQSKVSTPQGEMTEAL